MNKLFFWGDRFLHISLKLLWHFDLASFGDIRFRGALDQIRVLFSEQSHFLLKLLFLLLEILTIFQLQLLWKLLVFLRQNLGQLLVAQLRVFLGVLESHLFEKAEVNCQGLLW